MQNNATSHIRFLLDKKARVEEPAVTSVWYLNVIGWLWLIIRTSLSKTQFQLVKLVISSLVFKYNISPFYLGT